MQRVRALVEEWAKIGVSPVLVHYERPVWAFSQYFTQTKNYVLGIYPINPPGRNQESKKLDRSLYLGDVTSRGRRTIEGLIIKASLENPVRKTYEVIVEEGLSGNSFIGMSVDDTALYDYILQAMQTGKVLRITYVHFWDWEGAIPSAIFSYNTYYRIVEVKVSNVDFPGFHE